MIHRLREAEVAEVTRALLLIHATKRTADAIDCQVLGPSARLQASSNVRSVVISTTDEFFSSSGPRMPNWTVDLAHVRLGVAEHHGCSQSPENPAAAAGDASPPRAGAGEQRARKQACLFCSQGRQTPEPRHRTRQKHTPLVIVHSTPSSWIPDRGKTCLWYEPGCAAGSGRRGSKDACVPPPPSVHTPPRRTRDCATRTRKPSVCVRIERPKSGARIVAVPIRAERAPRERARLSLTWRRPDIGASDLEKAVK